MFHLFAAVVALERDLILERTMGSWRLPWRGRKDGRQPVMGEGKIALVYKLMRDRETLVSAVCATVGV